MAERPPETGSNAQVWHIAQEVFGLLPNIPPTARRKVVGVTVRAINGKRVVARDLGMLFDRSAVNPQRSRSRPPRSRY